MIQGCWEMPLEGTLVLSGSWIRGAAWKLTDIFLSSNSLHSLALSLRYLGSFFTVSEEKETGHVSILQQKAEVRSSDWVQQSWCIYLKQIQEKLDFVGPLKK